MNVKVMLYMTAIGIAIAGAPLAALSVESAPIATEPRSEFLRSAAAAEPAIPPASESSTPEPEKKKKSKRPAPKPKPVAVELTEEEATARAADPKAPSGALIVKPPERKGPAAKPPSSPPPSDAPARQDERAQ